MTDRSTTPPLRAVRMAANCPICGKPGATGYRPFCSKRCANIDLGRWLKEGWFVVLAYVVAFFVSYAVLGWEPYVIPR